MLKDKPIRVAFLLSIGLHSVLFAPPFDFFKAPPDIQNKNIEVTYIEIEKKIVKTSPIPLDEKKTSLKIEKKNLPKETPEEQKIGTDPILPKEKMGSFPIKNIKTIDLNTISYEDGKSTSLNYLRTVRNKINTYIHKNYLSLMGRGEAVVHFVLNSRGTVCSAVITKGNIDNNRRLKALCLDSIYHSSPFKPFPEDLDLETAAFNISISFK